MLFATATCRINPLYLIRYFGAQSLHTFVLRLECSPVYAYSWHYCFRAKTRYWLLVRLYQADFIYLLYDISLNPLTIFIASYENLKRLRRFKFLLDTQVHPEPVVVVTVARTVVVTVTYWVVSTRRPVVATAIITAVRATATAL